MAIAMTRQSDPARAAGLLEATLTDVEAAIAQDPNTAAHYRRAWDLYRQLGRYDEALAAAQRAVHLAPRHRAQRALRGAWLRGRYRGHARRRRAGIALTPDLATAHFARATALLLMGDFDGGWRE
ncbi:MAG TPA: tetratricopeptide repeat protein [Acetobacteraceae bacterium]|jgi:tetratricopeptide (TPR) repeat protein|nr:tetratricopeptide repeat protein [Acetobacteraceae bacterium]